MTKASKLRRRLSWMAVIVTVWAALAAIPASSASADAPLSAPGGSTNPFSPSYQHPYRGGAVPTLAAQQSMDAFSAAHPTSASTPSNNMTFHGGVDGIGVTYGVPQVYLVFWGTQWGTATTNSHGDLTFSGDSYAGAPTLQELFKGLGTGGEQWSGVLTQYCEGVAAGSETCPANNFHIGTPTGNVLAGVWYDNASAVPDTATGSQIEDEAVRAAVRFGNTTSALNRQAQYIILSPTGTHPDSFNLPNVGFCAWHGSTAGSNSTYGDIAFTNLPYVMDAGSACGMNWENQGAAGNLDGYTINAGHEYAETVTDQTVGGWYGPDSSDSENADKCAWGRSGFSYPNVTMATGSFQLSPTWSNIVDPGQFACRIARAPVNLPSPSCWSQLTDNRSTYIADVATVYAYERNTCSGKAQANAQVTLHIQHTYIGDLVIDLVAPSGNAYNLTNRSGGSAHDIDQTYTLNLSNEDVNGTWAIRIRDAAAADTGRLNSLTLNFQTVVATASAPNVVGDNETDARNVITAAGLTVGAVSRVVNSAPVGTVISQTPSAGVPVPLGNAINLTVSLGAVTVPDLFALSQTAARGRITGAGLVVGAVSSTNNCLDPGTVQSQSPSAGTLVAPGSPVSFTYSTCTGGGNPK